MSLVDQQRITFATITCLPGIGTGAYIPVQAVRDQHVKTSIFVTNNFVADKELIGSITVGKSYPSAFYGLEELRQGQFQIDNSDQKFNFLLNENAKGRLVRIRRIDENTNEAIELFQGVIGEVQVGDEVDISIQSLDLNVFDVELPRNRVLTNDQAPENGLSNNDVTVNFPNATDINVPIPFVFGHCESVPLSYVYFNDFSALGEGFGTYDYLVCEEIVDVEKVYWLNENTWTEKFTVSGTAVAGSANIILIDPLDQSGASDFYGSGFYVGMYIYIESGKGAGQVRQIIAYDSLLKLATVDENWTVNPDSTSKYSIREYLVLPGNVYFGRTAIRFSRPQKQGDALHALMASVTKYSNRIRKNLLARSEDFDHSTWIPFNTTPMSANLPVVDDEKVENVFGDKTANRIFIPGTGEGIGFSQFIPGTFSGEYSFSIWVKPFELSQSSMSHSGTINHDSGNTNFSILPTFDPGDDWTRLTAQVTIPSSLNGITLTWSLDTVNGSNQILDYYGAQFEKGGTVTWYEGKRNLNESLVSSFPDAIKSILSNAQWGLNQLVDEDSFDTAEELLSDLYLRCEGSVPTSFGDNLTAKDLLDELCRVRGMRLNKNGSAWSIRVDAPATPVASFGTGDTGLNNIIEVGKVSQGNLNDSVKTLRLNYGETFLPGDGSVIRPFRLSAAVDDHGKEEEINSNFIKSHNTGDRTVQYLANRMRIGNKTFPIQVTSQGRALEPGDVIEVNVGRRQVENLAYNSEDFSASPWLVGFGTVVPNTALSPDGRSYSASLATEDANGLFIGGGLSLASNGDSRKAFGSVWARCPGNTPSTLEILLTTTNPALKQFVLGKGWKKCEVEGWMSSVESTPQLVIQSFNRPGTQFELAQAHLCLDTKKGYIRTGLNAVAGQTLWQVMDTQYSSEEVSDLTLVPYSSSIFNYTKSNWQQQNGDSSGIDPRTIPPYQATNITVPPAPPTPTAAAGVDLSPEGRAESWAEIGFTMPEQNCVSVLVQIRKVDDSGAGVALWNDAATVTIEEFGLGTTAKVKVRGLTPGLNYQVRCISFNSAGLSTSTITNPAFVARGDVTPPASATALTLVQGSGKSVEIIVGIPGITHTLVASNGTTSSFVKPVDDFSYVRLFRSTVWGNPNQAGFTPSLIARARKDNFHDNNVQIGQTYYYWAQIEDYTGNTSAFFPDGGTSNIQVLPIDGGIEIKDGTIKAQKLIIGNFDNIKENPAFELGDVGYAYNSPQGNPWSILSFGGRSGPWSAQRVALGTTAAMTASILSEQFWQASEGQKFYISAWVKMDSGNPQAKIYAFFTFRDSSLNGISQIRSNEINANGTWQKLELTATAPATSAYVRDGIGLDGHSIGIYYVDDIEVRRVVEDSIIDSLSAGKIKTGTLVVDGSSAGADSIQIRENTGAEISFRNLTGTTVYAQIDASLARTRLRPFSDGVGDLDFGQSSVGWDNINLWTEDSRGDIKVAGVLQFPSGGGAPLVADTTGTPSTENGYVRVKVGSTTRYIKLYSTAP